MKNPEVTIDIPRSNCKIIANEYQNGNWKLTFQNKENNSFKVLERSFNDEQLIATVTFVVASAAQHGIYKDAKAALQQIKNKINSIKTSYVQTKNV